jgi:hypothetical protein
VFNVSDWPAVTLSGKHIPPTTTPTTQKHTAFFDFKGGHDVSAREPQLPSPRAIEGIDNKHRLTDLGNGITPGYQYVVEASKTQTLLREPDNDDHFRPA